MLNNNCSLRRLSVLRSMKENLQDEICEMEAHNLRMDYLQVAWTKLDRITKAIELIGDNRLLAIAKGKPVSHDVNGEYIRY